MKNLKYFILTACLCFFISEISQAQYGRVVRGNPNFKPAPAILTPGAFRALPPSAPERPTDPGRTLIEDMPNKIPEIEPFTQFNPEKVNNILNYLENEVGLTREQITDIIETGTTNLTENEGTN